MTVRYRRGPRVVQPAWDGRAIADTAARYAVTVGSAAVAVIGAVLTLIYGVPPALYERGDAGPVLAVLWLLSVAWLLPRLRHVR